MCAFEENILKLEKYCAEYNQLKEETIIDIIKGNAPQAEKSGNVIVFSVTGKPIIPRSENQQRLVDAFREHDMVFAIGPAGSGKLYDALQDMIPAAKLQEYMDQNVIQIAPLAFMRGRTLNDAVVILDEAQNTTSAQIKMFLTRMGMNTKMIVTGDMTQIDLPSSQVSGLVQALRILKGVKQALRILKGVKGIAFIELNQKDIVRHKLVTRIVEAYDKYEKEQKAERERRKEETIAKTTRYESIN